MRFGSPFAPALNMSDALAQLPETKVPLSVLGAGRRWESDGDRRLQGLAVGGRRRPPKPSAASAACAALLCHSLL